MAVSTKRLVHAHGCTNCHGRYEDICTQPELNARCGECQGRLGWAALIIDRLPRDCCRAHSRPTRKEENALYALSKGCPWWICPVCARTQPFMSPANPDGALA